MFYAGAFVGFQPDKLIAGIHSRWIDETGQTESAQHRDHSGGGGSGTDPSQAGDGALAALSTLRRDQKIALRSRLA